MTRNLLWLLRTVSRSFIRSSNYYIKKHFKIMEVDNDDAFVVSAWIKSDSFDASCPVVWNADAHNHL